MAALLSAAALLLGACSIRTVPAAVDSNAAVAAVEVTSAPEQLYTVRFLAGEESLSAAAADAVRQTGILTGLEQNSQNNSQTAQKLKNRDKNDNELHDL